MLNPFKLKGNWYRGNLHVHTKYSDGELFPEEVIEGYRKNNYHFLAITDHNRVTSVEGYSEKDFLTFSGSELDLDKSRIGTPYHLIGINLKKVEKIPKEITVQEGIEFLKALGGEVILAHPYWSGLTVDDFISLQGYLGIEIFNYSCLTGVAKGASLVQWDDLLTRGKLNWGFAVDDAHYRRPDAYGGWIMVKASRLEKGEIISSIKKGFFYSSSGPQIKDINLNEEMITVSSSPVSAINFICDNGKGKSIRNKDGKTLTRAEFKFKGEERYLRVECMDGRGRCAWTNPLLFNQANSDR